MNFRTLSKLSSLRRNLRLKASEIEKMQSTKLKEIILHAYNNVPFYHAKFRGANLKPDDIHTLEDLKKIPITTKSEVQTTPLNEMIAKNVKVNECVKNLTGGSTGIPLTTFEDEQTVGLEGAVWLRFYFENGLRLWDKRLMVRNPHTFKKESLTQRLGIMRVKHVSIFDSTKKQLALLNEYKPDAIEGLPSALSILADACKHNGTEKKPRLVFTYGEVLNEVTSKLISSVFEAELFDYYGCSELNLMAWECRSHTGYHMNVDTLIMEFLSDAEEVAPGERGEIVSTSLVNHAMPLIRYKVGDIGVPVKEQCSCGITLPLMKMVEGRLEDLLITPDGRILPPSVFHHFWLFFEDFDRIRQFKVIQEKRDKLLIQLALKEGFLIDEKLFERARKEIQKLFGADMQVEFQIVETIDRDPSGKLRAVVSRIPVKF